MIDLAVMPYNLFAACRCELLHVFFYFTPEVVGASLNFLVCKGTAMFLNFQQLSRPKKNPLMTNVSFPHVFQMHQIQDIISFIVHELPLPLEVAVY